MGTLRAGVGVLGPYGAGRGRMGQVGAVWGRNGQNGTGQCIVQGEGRWSTCHLFLSVLTKGDVPLVPLVTLVTFHHVFILPPNALMDCSI